MYASLTLFIFNFSMFLPSFLQSCKYFFNREKLNLWLRVCKCFNVSYPKISIERIIWKKKHTYAVCTIHYNRIKIYGYIYVWNNFKKGASKVLKRKRKKDDENVDRVDIENNCCHLIRHVHVNRYMYNSDWLYTLREIAQNYNFLIIHHNILILHLQLYQYPLLHENWVFSPFFFFFFFFWMMALSFSIGCIKLI